MVIMEDLRDIMVAVDFSAGCSAALRQASRIAVARGARLHVIHVIDALVVKELSDLLPGDSEQVGRQIAKDARDHLTAWTRDQLGDGDVASISVEVGAAIEELIRKVRELCVNLLVLGVRGSTVGIGTGSVASKAIKKAPTEVLLVHPDQQDRFRCLVVGIDFSETSRLVAVQAARLAVQEQAALHLVHVYRPPWEVLHYYSPTPEASPDFQRQYRDALDGRLRSVLREVQRGADVDAHCALFESRSHGRGLAEYARRVDADLIAVGTRGHSKLRYLFVGSTAERVLRELDVSLLALKPPNFTLD